MNRKLVLMTVLTLLVSMLSVASNVQPVKASGTIYIRADGSIDPPTASISTSDNVTYTFTGNINDSIVVERSSIVIDGAGCIVEGTGSGNGIRLSASTNVTIQNTTIKAFYYGILLPSNNNSVLGNNITANNGYGIKLISSNSNSVSGNNITANNESGIWLTPSSSNNSISGNNITANNWHGIRLDSSSGNSISGNNITNNDYGIRLSSSSGNSISGNNIAENKYFDGYGIHLYFCANNTISGNDIANNYYGILLISSSDNRFYYNNFINNTQQVYFPSSSYPNVWDDGYPSGGNYWSDYLSRYSNASQIDASGIWNQSYNINTSNTDNYPLMNQYVIPEFPSFLIVPLFMSTTLLAMVFYRRKHKTDRMGGSFTRHITGTEAEYNRCLA